MGIFSSKIDIVLSKYSIIRFCCAGYHANLEHQRWEQSRLNAATSRYGARDAKAKEKEYDLLTEDDMIEFVQAATRKGTVKDEGE